MASDALTGQVALVTGGSAGLGLAIATALAQAGGSVVVASRSAARCEQAAAQVSAAAGRPAAGRACDVTDEAAVAALTDWVQGPFRTPLNDGVDDDPQVRRFLTSEVPLGRWAVPGEITSAALMLTDPRSAYLTGVVLPVDGGWTAH